MTSETKSLRTQFPKSPWILFWVAPFALLFLTGLILVLSEVMTRGFSDPWHDQGIGILLFSIFTTILWVALLRGLTHDEIRISTDSVESSRGLVVWQRSTIIPRKEIERVIISTTDILFDVHLLVDGKRVALATSVGSKSLKGWLAVLSELAPVQHCS